MSLVFLLLLKGFAFCLGDHTKALIGQLIIFNQILGELRQDIREQVCVACISFRQFISLFMCMSLF